MSGNYGNEWRDYDPAKQRAAVIGKPSKYHNVKWTINGETFDSKREAARWQDLKLREIAGEITALVRQVHYPLHCPVEGGWGLTVQVCEYIADFQYFDCKDDRVHVVDAKGKQTQVFAMKSKWMNLEYGITIELV